MLKDRTPRRRPEAQNIRRKFSRGLRWKVPWRWIAAIAPIFLVANGTYAVINSSLFTIDEVKVEGTQTLDPASVAEMSALEGQNMLRLTDDAAIRRISALPAVESVSIDRQWPDAVVIKVQERAAVAYWSVNGHDFAVDKDGVVLTGGVPQGNAPRIVDVTPGAVVAPGERVHPDALALAQRIQAESPRFLEANVSELEYATGVGVTVIFEGGMRVTFGDERSYEYKVAVLAQLLQELETQGVQPTAVDLRFGERVTYE